MLYIGTDDGIYRWVEKSFWPAFHSLQNRQVVSLAVPRPGLLAAVDGDGQVWESTDNGLEWCAVPAPGAGKRPLAVAPAATADAVVLTTRPMGLYQRAIGTPLPEGAGNGSGGLLRGLLGRVRRAAGSGSGTALLARPGHASTTIEAVWSSLNSPPAPEQVVSPGIRTLVTGAGESSPWFAAVTGAGLWRSDDRGQSWQPCPGLPAEIYAIRIAQQPRERVAVGTSDGCWTSIDGGRTWEERSGGLEKARHVRAIELHPQDPDTMLAGAAPRPGEAAQRGTQYALYESTDGGKTWTHVKRGFPPDFDFDVISDIRFDPAAPVNAIVALESGELWRTRNGGEWWEPIARQIRAARVLCATT